jgi:hypothetical protein
MPRDAAVAANSLTVHCPDKVALNEANDLIAAGID